MANRADITPELCRQLLRYEPETGRLFWKERPRHMFNDRRTHSVWNARYAGREAFTAHSGGYRVGRICDTMFKAHRVAWAIIHGKWPDAGCDVDHINGFPADNRIANLRAVPHKINGRNVRRPKNNSSGRVGVSWCSRVSRWEAYISSDNGRNHLGHFESYEDAVAARAKAETEIGYHPNHGR